MVERFSPMDERSHERLVKIGAEDATDAADFIGNIRNDLRAALDSIDAAERLVPGYAHLMPDLRRRVVALQGHVSAMVEIARSGFALKEQP